VVFFSNHSGNTARFVAKLGVPATRIPLQWDAEQPVLTVEPYVLVVPTYGAGRDAHVVPRQVKQFLNVPQNRANIRAVIGMGNTNFGEHFCRAAEVISAKTGVPIIGRVEIFGTPADVTRTIRTLEEIENHD
jgi:protein involved in ribonucleotide reduction